MIRPTKYGRPITWTRFAFELAVSVLPVIGIAALVVSANG